MILRRARIELEYDEQTITCSHHPGDKVEPTLVIIDGKEYLGHVSVEIDGDTYIVKFKQQ